MFDDDRPQFARAGAPGSTVELRGECPRGIINVLDAIAIARDISRTALVNEILGAYTEKQKHEAILIYRVAVANPVAPESSGANQIAGGR